ncbi:hypothetical protein ES703_51159 [subsurface metagenome]
MEVDTTIIRITIGSDISEGIVVGILDVDAAFRVAVNNVTIIGSSTLDNNVFYILRTEDANISNINSSGNYYGIDIQSSDNNNLTNIIVNSNSKRGINILNS